MLNNEQYDFQIDIWSFGIMIYEMVTGYSPFTDIKTFEIVNKIKDYKNFSEIERKLIKSDASHNLIDLLCKMIVADPKDRITINNMFQHEWFLDNLK